MKIATVSAAKNHLSALLAEVSRGETVIITDHRRPVARLERLEMGAANSGISDLVRTGVLSPSAQTSDLKAFFALPRAIAPQARLAEAVNEDRDSR